MNKNHIIGVIIALLIVGAGSFYAGQTMAKGAAPTVRTGFGGTAGAAGFAGRGTRGAAGGGFTAGQIVSTSNGSISIQQQNGSSSEIVLISPTTMIFKQTAGTAADLTDGTQVTVTGTTNGDGSLTATSIQIRPAGMGFGGRTPATTPAQ